MSTVSQRSFAGGEIAPALYARVDTVKYQTGVRTMRNFLLMRHGGAQNRPGTGFIGEVKDSTKTVKLIPFIFNSDQTYVLEFGHQYIRVIRNEAYQYDLTLTITAISNANPGVVTYTGTDPANGDEVYISGVTGAIGTYLNNRNFKVANVNTGSNTFELTYLNGTNVNTTSMGSYTSGGTAKRVYTISTPYVEADLQEIQYVQSADVVTLVHPNYAPRELSRTGHTSWTLSLVTFEPSISRPNGGSASGNAGASTYRYRITAVATETAEESLPGYETAKVISGATQANPVVITATAHGHSNGDEVFITGVGGMVEINDRLFTVANITANTFELQGVDGTGYSAYTSGGTAALTYIRIDSVTGPTAADPISLTWNAVAGAQEYNIYGRGANGVYGFIGVSGTNSYSDVGADPDLEDTPPAARNPFDETNDYPSAVTYIQQRLTFANTNNDPEKVWASRSAQFKNFTVSSPIQDDDAVTFTMSGRQVNEVRHMLDLGIMLILTSAGEWTVGGDSSGVIKPGEINLKQQGYSGSSTLPPLIVGGNALFVQARGTIVRDLSFEFESDGYRGNDLTIFSAHMFDAYTLEDWAYQQIPHSIVWAVRSDGTLLGLTYVREHQLFGWHRHDFDGTVENVCVVPEGTQDAVYLVIKRTVNSATVRYVERMKSRQIDDIVESVFADCALSYDGRNTNTMHTMTLSGGTDWDYLETLTLTSSTSFFTAADVGNAIFLTGSDGTVIRFTIFGYTNGTVVTGKAHKTVPVAMRSTAMAVWSRAVDEVTGLWHIEGKQVSVFADGFVVANPNNESYTLRTVTNGAITLDKPYAVIHVGLPYLSDIETLNIDTAQGETLADKKSIVQKVTLHVESSRGIWVGAKPPLDDDDDPLEELVEVKIRSDEDYDSPVDLETGTVDVIIQPEWNSNGRVFVRQTDPLPLAVLAISPAGMFPFRRG